MKSITIETKVEVSFDRIADLICCAMEGGIGYWGVISGYKEPEEVWRPRDSAPDSHVYKHNWYPISKGGAVLLQDNEDDSKTFTFDLPAVERGLALMAKEAPQHWQDFLREDEDAVTGDVFVQLAVFGEVIYG